MDFQPVFEAAKLDSHKRVCVHQAVVEARLLSQGGVKIAKVLSIVTECRVTPSEVFNGEARYNGRAGFRVIFVDTEGKNHSMEYNADFTDKLSSDCIKAGLKPALSANILDTDIVSVDERELKLACVVEVALDAVLSENLNVLTKGGENVYTHEGSLEFSRLVAENTLNFTLTDQMDALNGEILLCEAKAVTLKRTAHLDSILLEGNVICDVVCEDEEGMLSQLRRVVPFAEEISAPDTREDHAVLGTVSVHAHSATYETDGDKRAAALEFVLTAHVKSFAQESAEAVTDAFSVTNELQQTSQSFTVHACKHNATYQERVEGAVTLDVNMPIADSVLAVTASKLNIASAAAHEGRIVCDGIVSANVLYYSAEQNLKNSVAVELPFSLPLMFAEAAASDTVTAKGIVSSLAAKIQRGNEIVIKAEIEIEAAVSGVHTYSVITELALGEERVLPTAAFSVHIAKGGETLWDVAKALGLTPELVLTQNPGLSLPLAGGERVLGYRHLKR